MEGEIGILPTKLTQVAEQAWVAPHLSVLIQLLVFKVSDIETLSPVGDIHCRKDFQLVQKYLTVFKAIYINDRWVTFKANTGAADTTANHRFGKYIKG